VLLDECLNKKPVIQQVIETSSTRMLESVVSFRQGKSTIDNSQLPNVERIGMYMKKHNEAKVVIKGFASPEGALELNERLALARAYAVKNMLIKKYGISSERILAQGEGVGNMYSDPDWNRVSICTIKEESK
jgi:outer membrane protein OmpA-like peptidoglycan-associated protein